MAWHYAENQFEVQTRSTYKLMNILLGDHGQRIASALAAAPADVDLLAISARTAAVRTQWDAGYTGWIAARGLYKGRTQAVEAKMADLSTLRIKQWDIAIQGTFLDGTPEYTQLLPNGRGPFQRGPRDSRLAEVKALQTRLNTFPLPPMTALALTVGAYHGEFKTLRDAQQVQESTVDTASTTLEGLRKAVAVVMHKNLGRLLEKYGDQPEKVEDFWQLSLISGGTPPPEDDPPAPPVP